MLGPIPGSERAGALELDLGHAHLTFGVVVAEGYARVRRAAQHLIGLFFQAAQQVDRAALGCFPGPAVRGFGRIELAAFAYEGLVLSSDPLPEISGKSSRRVAGVFERAAKQLAHFLSPRLLILFGFKLEFAQRW